MDFVKKYNTVKKRPSLSTWSLLWCIMYIITWKIFYHPTGHWPLDWVWLPHDNVPTNRKTTLTIIHDKRIIASHSAAFLSTFHQASYHLLSHPDVSILNPQYIHIHSATVARIQRIQLIAFLIVSSSHELTLSSLVWIVWMSDTWHFSHHLLQSVLASAKVMLGIEDNHKTANHSDIISLFIVLSIFLVILLCYHD